MSKSNSSKSVTPPVSDDLLSVEEYIERLKTKIIQRAEKPVTALRRKFLAGEINSKKYQLEIKKLFRPTIQPPRSA